MPDHCFTYGSLMCDDIMGAVCAAAPLSPLPARLAGFRRAPVIGVEYPGMVPAADGLVGAAGRNSPITSLGNGAGMQSTSGAMSHS